MTGRSARRARTIFCPSCPSVHLLKVLVPNARERRDGDLFVKANRKMIWNADKAEVGIGTLIVFIAMVLVAAVAAAVLIGTSGNLQQRAQATGEGAVRETSEAMKIISVDGVTNTAKDEIDIINFHVSLAAGARPIGLDQVLVQYATGDVATSDLSQSSTAASTTAFKTEIVRLITNTDSAATILYPGEIVKITVGTVDTGTFPLGLSPRTELRITLVPEFGNSVPLEFRTPSIYDKTYVQIR